MCRRTIRNSKSQEKRAREKYDAEKRFRLRELLDALFDNVNLFKRNEPVILAATQSLVILTRENVGLNFLFQDLVKRELNGQTLVTICELADICERTSDIDLRKATDEDRTRLKISAMKVLLNLIVQSSITERMEPIVEGFYSEETIASLIRNIKLVSQLIFKLNCSH
jgi:hypothetical protein